MRLTLLVVVCLMAAPLAGQEISVPIDSAGRLQVIDRALERRLALFPDIPGFIEARLFRAPDGTFTLEITHRVDGRLARTRRAFTAAEAEAFRNRVIAALATRAPNALLDQAGRGELLRGAFALALGYYSYAMPIALDIDDGRTAVGVGTITAAAGFFLPLALTTHAPVTKGQASLAMWGATRGIFHGMMTAAFFDETSSRAVFSYGLVGSIAEGVAGYVLADRMRMAQGHADAMGMLGDIGGGVGLATAYLIGSDTQPDQDGIWAAGVVSSFLGVAAGDRLARWEPTTRGDVGVFRTTTLLGTWIGFSMAYVASQNPFGNDDGKGEVFGALVGTGGGLVAAHLLTRGRDFTNADGTIVSISALGGGLLGAGLGYLATPGGNDENQAVVLASAAGATLGFGIVYAALRAEARNASESGALSLSVNPLALALRDGPIAVPLAAIAIRF